MLRVLGSGDYRQVWERFLQPDDSFVGCSHVVQTYDTCLGALDIKVSQHFRPVDITCNIY